MNPLDWVRPFVQYFDQGFMQNAAMAATAIAIGAGVMGYVVVLRSLSFAAHALAHVGFAGATGSVLIGVDLTAGMVTVTAVSGAVMGLLGDSLRGRDVAIGTVLAFMSGLGILFTSLATRQAATATNILFGNLFGISSQQVALMAACAVLVVAGVAVAYRPLLFASVDPAVARLRGVPVFAIGVAFMVALAVVVALAVLVVGVLLIFALLVTPAATAVRLTASPARAMLLSVSLSLLAVWVGLLLANAVPWPPSFFITLVSFVSYLCVVGFFAAPGGSPRRWQFPSPV